jgi:hypothetical protein
VNEKLRIPRLCDECFGQRRQAAASISSTPTGDDLDRAQPGLHEEPAGFERHGESGVGTRQYVRRDARGLEMSARVSATDAGLLGRILFFLGGAGMIGSPFLPWISATFIFSVNASLYDAAKMTNDYSGFGEVLGIGIFTLLGGFLRVTRSMSLGWGRAWAILGGGAGLVEVVIRYTRFQDSFGSEFGLASLQFGFYLLAIASAMAVVGALVDRE